MKKSLKIILIVLGVLALLIIFDTLQAKIFDNSPILKVRENLDNGNINYIDKGILVDTYYYNTGNKKALFKWEPRLFSENTEDKQQFDFYYSEYEEDYDNIKFNKYYFSDSRQIYLASNIKEFYVTKDKTMNLRTFLTNDNITLDNALKKITDNLELDGALYDGGTKIYKSKEKDITIITCNTIEGNKDVYIGNYLVNYEDGMCGR